MKTMLQYTVLGLGLALGAGSAKLGAAESPDAHATFFMGRIKFSQNDGNDCGGVGQDFVVAEARTRQPLAARLRVRSAS